MPSFGLDAAEVYSRASPGCPNTFIQLALQCCDPEPSKRPQIRVVLQQLREMERAVLEADDKTTDDPAAKSYHVGSMNFGGKLKTRKQLSRPVGPGRIPSFEGTVGVPRQGSISSSGSDEAVEDVLKALEDVSVTGGRDSLRRKEEGWAEDQPGYSTFVIGRASKITNQSSVLTVRANQPASADKAVNTSTIIKTHQPAGSEYSIPSIPSAWLVKGDEAGPASSDESSTDDSAPVTPDPESAPIAPAPSKIDSVASYMTARTNTPSITNAIVNGGEDQDEEQDYFFAATSRFDNSLHRFSLVKPGWRIFSSSTSLSNASRELMASRASLCETPPVSAPGDNRRQSIELPASKRKSGLDFANALARCDFCERRLGLMKQYLECDDCGFKFVSHA